MLRSSVEGDPVTCSDPALPVAQADHGAASYPRVKTPGVSL